MNSNNNSSRWWKIDFHVHTPISTDFADKKPEEKNISPEDYIKAVVNAQLDAVVLTDHNHCGLRRFVLYRKKSCRIEVCILGIVT